MNTLLTGFIDLLYPRGLWCVGCGAPLELDAALELCPSCISALTIFPADAPCPLCGRPHGARGCRSCLAEPPAHLSAVYAAYAHDGAARELVHALKYKGYIDAALGLAQGMAAVCADIASHWDALVPIPLHKARQRQRGFNQARVLADRVGEQTGLPVRELLVRRRNTTTQTQLGPVQRHENLAGAFAACGDVSGLRILLIDDVCTTGATAEAAASALAAEKAAEIGILTATIARLHELDDV